MNLQNLTKDKYLDDFYICVGKEKSELVLSRNRILSFSRTQAFRHNVQQQKPIQLTELESFSAEARDSPGTGTVLVVENIGLEWIAALGVVFQISPSFFAEHATNPPGQTPWKAIIGTWSEDHRTPLQNGVGQQDPNRPIDVTVKARSCWHVDGVIEFVSHGSGLQNAFSLTDPNFLPRQVAHDAVYGSQATSRISYCLVRPNLYLFLVDAPMQTSPSNLSLTRTQLRVPLALNRAGLVVPQLQGQPELSLSRLFHGFFSHPWHLHLLFVKSLDGSIPLAPETIFHLLVSSVWSTNLHILELSIQRISFEDIRRPSISINDKLHDYRRDLSVLLSQVAQTSRWLPPSVKVELEATKNSLPAAKYIGYPDVILQQTLDSAKSLEEFLMHTFNLLLSTIGVFEAEASKNQTRRAEVLTQLALIYVPLSFVTGVFGMNVKEINASPLSVWVCIVGLVITVVCTIATFAAFKWWQGFSYKRSQTLPGLSAHRK